MEYLNEFHKQWIERSRKSIVSWSKQPASLEEARQQQAKLNEQKAIREGKSKIVGIDNDLYFIDTQIRLRTPTD